MQVNTYRTKSPAKDVISIITTLAVELETQLTEISTTLTETSAWKIG